MSSSDLAGQLQGNSPLRFAPGTESVLLADGILSVGTSTNEAFLGRLYEGLLGRPQDSNGLASWDAVLRTSGKANIARNFLASAEYQILHPGLSDSEFVSSLYEGVLGRPAEVGAVAFWTEALAGGLSRAQAAVAFTDSAEARQHWSGETSAGLFARDLNAAIVREDYMTGLGREADTDGLTAWTNVLNNGGTAAQLARDLTASAEFQALHGQQTDQLYVNSLYLDGLGRPADAGSASWLAALQSGASRGDILSGIAQSPEAQQHLQWAALI
jgi:hypothetical protein